MIIRDLGEVTLQQLIDCGVNAFAFELMAESYVRDVLPQIKEGIQFTVMVRRESGKAERVPVRFTIVIPEPLT